MQKFIETPPKDYKKHKQIKGPEDMNKKQYKTTKALHRKLIKDLRKDIKKHKLLMKQAKLVYKLSK